MMLDAMASAERAARAIRRADKLMSKETPLPAPADRWPRADHTKTPHARP